MRYLRYLLILFAVSGLVHIFTIFAIPFFAKQKVWTGVTDFATERTFTVIEDYKTAMSLLGTADPAMVYGLCWFDLDDGPLKLDAAPRSFFWNVTVFNDSGEMIYSLHDAASRDGRIDLELTNVLTEPELEIDSEPVKRIPVVDPLSPPPRPRPLTKTQIEALIEDAKVALEEDPTIRAVQSADRAFAVVKVFRAVSTFDKSIKDTLKNATCV